MTAFHKTRTAYVEMDAFDSDQRMRTGMVNGSRELLKALQTGRGAEKFLWSVSDGGANWRPTQATGQFHYRVDLIRQREERAERLRVSRDPCPVCATRMDIGCRHRRVA